MPMFLTSWTLWIHGLAFSLYPDKSEGPGTTERNNSATQSHAVLPSLVGGREAMTWKTGLIATVTSATVLAIDWPGHKMWAFHFSLWSHLTLHAPVLGRVGGKNASPSLDCGWGNPNGLNRLHAYLELWVKFHNKCCQYLQKSPPDL